MAGAICGITSGVVAYIFGCHRTKKKNEKEKIELLRYIKLQNNLYDVAEQRWKEEYDGLYASYLSLKKDTEDRDYGTNRTEQSSRGSHCGPACDLTFIHSFIAMTDQKSRTLDAPKNLLIHYSGLPVFC